jgi:hypothetical protein
LQREVAQRLKVGAEVYFQTPGSPDASTTTGGNLAVIYKRTPHWSLLVSGGPQFEGGRRRPTGYLSLKADY